MKRSELQSWGFRWRGAIGIAVLAPLGLMALLSPPPTAGAPWVQIAAEILAWPTFVAGAVLRLWSTLYIGGRKREQVVTDGPYSVCRNPLYVGSTLLAASAGMFMQSPLFTAGAVLVAAGYAFATVPVEEEFLRQNLGQPYVEYCQRVPRYWPRWSLFTTPPHIDVEVRALRAECAGALGYVLIPLATHICVQLRLQPWWPHLFPFV